MLLHSDDRILVAGASGMAGSAIYRALQRSGYTHVLTPKRAELDLLDGQAVQVWFAQHQPTVVVLAAAKVGGIHANATEPVDFLLDNLKIETHLIETAWRSGVRRLLFLGSSCIYPKLAPQPIREEALLSGLLEPTNEWYAIAKIAGIKLCQALRLKHGFDAISLMPTNLYGPGDNYHPTNSHVLPALIRRFHEAVTWLSSHPGELPPEVLPEPYVTLSRHTPPIIHSPQHRHLPSGQTGLIVAA
jgi:GDP-L-fucose synthase